MWILDPNVNELMNSGAKGVKGHFGGRAMNQASKKGAVFAHDGELVHFDLTSCTFTKVNF